MSINAGVEWGSSKGNSFRSRINQAFSQSWRFSSEDRGAGANNAFSEGFSRVGGASEGVSEGGRVSEGVFSADSSR